MKKWLLTIVVILCCGNAFALSADLDGSGRVDLGDLAIFASQWLMEDTAGLLQNGDFEQGGAYWDLVDWTISGGKAVFHYTMERPNYMVQSAAITKDNWYQLSFDVSDVLGDMTIQIYLGSRSTTSAVIPAIPGHYAIQVQCKQSGMLLYQELRIVAGDANLVSPGTPETMKLDNIDLRGPQ